MPHNTNLLPIQSLWMGGPLTAMEKLSICSYLAHGHSYHLYVYSELRDIPSNTVIHDANEILPASMMFQDKTHDSFAMFSDYFRYKLLLEKGGWWSDLDMVCLQPLSYQENYVFSSQHESNGLQRVTNSIIKAPRRSALMEHLFLGCLSKSPAHLQWGETGPQLIHPAISKFQLQQCVKPASTFCPIPYARWPELILPRVGYQFGPNVMTVHFWNEMWRRFDADKNAKYSESCIYEQLKARYLPEPE